MYRRQLLLVLPIFALLLPTARTASATPPDTRNEARPSPSPAQAEAQRPTEAKPIAEAEATAAAVVEKGLLQPLSRKEAGRNHFSRVYIPPRDRRVRVLDRERSTDGRGAEFVAFAVDEGADVYARRADDDSRRWRKDAIVGCVYPARDEIFIKRGDKFFGAGLLLGQKAAATADDTVCRPAPTRVPSSPPTLATSQDHHVAGGGRFVP